jgi:hypothetical protein
MPRPAGRRRSDQPEPLRKLELVRRPARRDGPYVLVHVDHLAASVSALAEFGREVAVTGPLDGVCEFGGRSHDACLSCSSAVKMCSIERGSPGSPGFALPGTQ